MSRMVPPPIASWMLEHCIPGQRDEALAGDLEEAFQEGRTNGWYWRQSLAALAVGWMKYLGDRTALIVFALLWSMLAPAWTAIVERIQNRDVAWPASVAAWLMLNLAFIWMGMLAFAGMHRRTVLAVHAKKLKRAFAVAAAVFLPTYFATYVLANLFVWPGIGVEWRLLQPLGEIVDLGVRADVLRVPYLVTLLWSMWRLTPALAVAPAVTVEWRSHGFDAAEREAEGTAEEMPLRDAAATHRMALFLVTAGLVNALIAAVVMCQLPEDHHPTLGSLAMRAVRFVAIGALAGWMGTYVYWHFPRNSNRDEPPLPFSLFALVCAAGWMWVPAMILFFEQDSAFGAGVALVAAFLLAWELRRILPALSPAENEQTAPEERSLFAESLYRSPAEPYGFVIALCLYGAGWAIAEELNVMAGALLALAAIFFVVKTTVSRRGRLRPRWEYGRAGLRLAALATPAILVTFWALLDGVAHRNHLAEVNAAGQAGAASAGDRARSKKEEKSSAHSGSGYESVVLWPYPPKKEIVAPVQPAALLAPGTKQPVVIRFNGEYWYLQPPNVRPGPQAHRATGTPRDVHIASANSLPLIMQAHQYLRSPIAVVRCREIRVEVENRETEPGSIALAVWLKNSSAPDGPAVYLGEQPIMGAGGWNGSPAAETLAFAVPAAAKVRAFDEISVMVLPDYGHQQVGPRVAIEQFEVVPR